MHQCVVRHLARTDPYHLPSVILFRICLDLEEVIVIMRKIMQDGVFVDPDRHCLFLMAHIEPSRGNDQVKVLLWGESRGSSVRLIDCRDHVVRCARATRPYFLLPFAAKRTVSDVAGSATSTTLSI